MQNSSLDRLIRATGSHVPFRLVLADITKSAEEIGKMHGASSEALKLLAETSLASLFLSSSLKFAGTVCVKVSFSGDISFTEADSTPQGLFRAMIPQDEIQKNKQYEPALSPQRFEVVTLDEHGKRVRESIIEAVSESMGRNLSVYMLQSAQTRSAVGIEARLNKNDPQKLDYAVGFYLEPFADIADDELAQLEKQIAKLPAFSEFFDGNQYNLNRLMEAISGEYPTTIVREIKPQPYCPCSKVRSLASLATIPTEDLQDLIQDGKNVELVCEFCRNKYIITPSEIQEILNDRLLK
ncbi:MAG: Hsp33 family molecular chaperone HslO [Hallerella porci]|uniref:Molecular chaperone Hsp33 n=1 Tax=Hallerella porci TaxID=1945871 RepID=A0ABX5LQG3_9BACT|nr:MULTISPECIES: Hsp33 family molecular chaperone HslO [Hallerella]MCI5601771.1 Hsp33 family molecular chaperone HslO [Hallerella sp.]MDY3921980.1 Hsp33 family molecular chaperone HslO [Hallerella porci]PWL03178.1 molecular chaperone Hsp33 [Hallerella porci]